MNDQDATCVPPAADGRHISGRLVELAMLHRRTAGELLAAHGLHVGQERLLFLIADGARPLSDLAAVMSVNPPTVTKMVGRLEAAGLVALEQSETDGRVRLAALTDDGRAALAGATQVWRTLEQHTTHDLDEAEQTTLATLLDRCTASLRDRANGSA